MKYVLNFALFLMHWTAIAQADSVDLWISRISNDQLSGTCHYAWTLEVDKNATDVFKLIKAGNAARKHLVDKLTDKERGVICHFILSTLSGAFAIQTLEMDETKVRYKVNGLEFEEKNGAIHVKVDDLKKIKTYWANRK